VEFLFGSNELNAKCLYARFAVAVVDAIIRRMLGNVPSFTKHRTSRHDDC